MNAGVPKQFLELEGKPVLCRVLEKFREADPEMELVVVLAEELFTRWDKIREQWATPVPHKLVEGGETRFHSTRKGLAVVESDGVVAVHDAARPMVSKTLIHKVLSEAGTKGGAVPVIPVSGSLRKVEGDRNTAVDRRYFREAQTPQAFSTTLLSEAFDQPYRPEYTDEASVVEAAGYPIHLVDGEESNIKLTTEWDLALVRTLVEGSGVW